MKMMRTSAAPSIQAGAPRTVTSDRAVDPAAWVARLSSDSSRVACIWCRITMKAPNAITAIEAPTATVVSSATREASDRR